MAEQTSSPIGARLGQRLVTLFRGSDQVVATDLGIGGLSSLDPGKTSGGDSPDVRRLRRAELAARSLFADQFDASRLAAYRDFREMIDEVPELGRSVEVLKDFVFGGDPSDLGQESLRLRFGDGARDVVKSVAAEAFAAVGGQPWAEAVFQEGVTLGDSPSEMVFTPNRLVGSKPLRPDRFAVEWDAWGRLVGYKIRASHDLSATLVPLAPWQVVHYAPDRLRGHRYGRSTLLTARKRWRGAQVAEDVLGVLLILKAAARKTMTYAVPASAEPDTIDAWVDAVAQGLESKQFFDGAGNLRRRIATILALDDHVVPYRQGNTAPTFHMEPAADLKQLVAVLEWYQESYFIATGVPAALAGMERNINAKATLEQQALHFIRIVKRRQRDVSRYVLQAILLGLGAAGIVPQPGEVAVEMAPSSQFNERLRAEILKLRAEAAKILGVDIGLDPIFVLTHALGLDEDTAAEVAETLRLPAPPPEPAPSAAEGRERVAADVRRLIASDPKLAEAAAALREGLADHLRPVRAEYAPQAPGA